MSLNLADLFEAVVDKLPDRTALVCGDERRTFSQLDQRANRLAHYLAKQGVQVGEHVGIHMRNSTQFVEALLACLKIRAVPVNINYRYTEDELTYLYNNSQIVSLIVDGEFVPIIAGALPAAGKVGDGHGLVPASDAQAYARQCALNAVAAAADVVGGVDRLTGVVKVTGFVASVPEFTGQPGVINGASTVLGEIFGEAGRHARAAVGVPVLPLDSPVEVEVVFSFA